jgi:hypothetical protein
LPLRDTRKIRKRLEKDRQDGEKAKALRQGGGPTNEPDR